VQLRRPDGAVGAPRAVTAAVASQCRSVQLIRL
jgi:hypothetical protein